MSKPKTYTFTSANKGDIDVTIVGEYTNRCVDVVVDIVEYGEQQEFKRLTLDALMRFSIGSFLRA